MSGQYGLKVHKLHADFRTGVEGMLETTKLKAIILGTRRYSSACSMLLWPVAACACLQQMLATTCKHTCKP